MSKMNLDDYFLFHYVSLIYDRETKLAFPFSLKLKDCVDLGSHKFKINSLNYMQYRTYTVMEN